MNASTPLKVLCLIFFLFLAFEGFSQQIPELESFNETRLNYNQKGMLILGTWAVGNMIWGGIGASRTSGETKAFHQMNLYWNSVNLVIAGFGYWQAAKEVPSSDFWATMDAQNSIEKILLVNAALDLAYMGGGLYLKERGLRKSNERLIGFGKSIILQGAFLMVFDGIMYGIHHSHANQISEIAQHISLGPQSFSFTIPLK